MYVSLSLVRYGGLDVLDEGMCPLVEVRRSRTAATPFHYRGHAVTSRTYLSYADDLDVVSGDEPSECRDAPTHICGLVAVAAEDEPDAAIDE